MSMTNVDHSVVRKLARWDPNGVPITSVYLTVDGRRYPRKSEYEVRLDELLRRARAQAEAEGLSKEALRSVLGDLEQVGVGGALTTDGRLLPVAGQHDDVRRRRIIAGKPAHATTASRSPVAIFR